MEPWEWVAEMGSSSDTASFEILDAISIPSPIGSMYGIYANIGGILMVNVTIYSIHGSYGFMICTCPSLDVITHTPITSKWNMSEP